jgi:hypothetical protein
LERQIANDTNPEKFLMSCEPTPKSINNILNPILWIIGALACFSMSPFLCIARSDNAPAGQTDLLSPVTISILGLSEDQIRQLEELKAQYLKQIGPLQNEYFSRKAEFLMLWQQSRPNRQECMARHRELLMLHEKISNCAIRYELDCRHVLSQEQEAQWRRMQADAP